MDRILYLIFMTPPVLFQLEPFFYLQCLPCLLIEKKKTTLIPVVEFNPRVHYLAEKVLAGGGDNSGDGWLVLSTRRKSNPPRNGEKSEQSYISIHNVFTPNF